MFGLLGKIVSRGWPAILLLWAIILAVLFIWSPPIDEVTVGGPGFTLPSGYDSRSGEELLAEGWGQEKSRLIIVFASDKKLTFQDEAVITKVIEDHVQNNELVADYLSPYAQKDALLKYRLTSRNGDAVMCAVVLKGQFIGLDTRSYVRQILTALAAVTEKHPHLKCGITDSAAIGADWSEATETSLDRTRVATVLLVVTILLFLYRSPITPIIPLASIGLSLVVSTCVTALLAGAGVPIPKLVPIYMVVILFGAGTDYCLFLIGRFREELVRGNSCKEAVRITITQIGGAIAASAGTTIAGLCMMFFADMGLTRATGPALGIGLAVGLLSALTFAPALMMVLGRSLFWPGTPKPVETRGTTSRRIWTWLADLVIKRPGLVITIALVGFIPLAVNGGIYGKTSYDLLKELPDDAPSVRGKRMLEAKDRFDPKSRSEQLVLVIKTKTGFDSLEGRRGISSISQALAMTDEVIEVRSLTQPLGLLTPNMKQYLTDGIMKPEWRWLMDNPETAFRLAGKTYTSTAADGTSSITRISVVLVHDAFSLDAIAMPDKLRPVVRAALDKSALENVEFHFSGITSTMNDIRAATRSDLRRLRWMVPAVLYVILVITLRSLISPIYLLATMVLNYFATLGMTQIIFVNFLGRDGLDWNVELFLFVLLIAIGVDYNIYIMSRLREELKHRPFRPALRRAIVSTGAIISSCGIIMSGTFGSMAGATLAVMVQIGVAMAIGVLFDAFIVRPLVMPALAMMVEKVKERFRPQKSPT